MKSQPCGKKAYIPKLTLSKVILNFKRWLKIAPNGSALCRCGIRIPFSPELKPNKDINDNDKNQKLGYVLLPEPQPNSEPLLIGLCAATFAQNAMLVAWCFSPKILRLELQLSYLTFSLLCRKYLKFVLS